MLPMTKIHFIKKKKKMGFRATPLPKFKYCWAFSPYPYPCSVVPPFEAWT
jgi:hypothetical protein